MDHVSVLELRAVHRALLCMTEDLLAWAVPRLANQRAVSQVPGRRLSVSWQTSSGRVELHPEEVFKIWDVFGRAEIDLFALQATNHCPPVPLDRGDQSSGMGRSGTRLARGPSLHLYPTPSDQGHALVEPQLRVYSHSIQNTVMSTRLPFTHIQFANKWQLFLACCSSRNGAQHSGILAIPLGWRLFPLHTDSITNRHFTSICLSWREHGRIPYGW